MIATYQTPGLEFDPGPHVYRKDGITVPSVTQILERTGFIDTTFFKPEHAERGTAVHNALHFHLDGDLDWDTLDPVLAPYVNAGLAFLENSGFEVHAHEALLYNEAGRYAGTVDLVGLYNGRPTVADWKTGDPDHVAACYQIAAYADTLYTYDKVIRDRMAIRLNRNGTYKLYHYTERFDSHVFKAARTIFHAQQGY